jgi:hypothetical protein
MPDTDQNKQLIIQTLFENMMFGMELSDKFLILQYHHEERDWDDNYKLYYLEGYDEFDYDENILIESIDINQIYKYMQYIIDMGKHGFDGISITPDQADQIQILMKL